MLKKLLKKLIRWALSPEKGELSSDQIHEITMTSSLKGVEIIAGMVIESNGLMAAEMMAAQFRNHSALTMHQASKELEGSEQRMGLELLATQLDDIANNVIETYSKDKSDAG